MADENPWPKLMTAGDLAESRILPVGEDTIRALAKKAGVGRILGRTYVFEPADVRALLASLPRPGETSPAAVGSQIRADIALQRALALSSEPKRTALAARRSR